MLLLKVFHPTQPQCLHQLLIRGCLTPPATSAVCIAQDIYHSEFGLGGLLQTAEMAWQQNIDLYATANWALVAAMELHARIINAWDRGRNEALLPPGFKFFDKSMPPAPWGTQW
jgi:hypothetical protein